MTGEETRLLHALASMCEQYLGSGQMTGLDHEGMSAGEDAVEILVKYGFVQPRGRGGVWTGRGKSFLGPNFRSA